MKLFFAFLLLCFLGGLVVSPGQSEVRLRVYLAVLCVALVIGFYAFHKI